MHFIKLETLNAATARTGCLIKVFIISCSIILTKPLRINLFIILIFGGWRKVTYNAFSGQGRTEKLKRGEGARLRGRGEY